MVGATSSEDVLVFARVSGRLVDKLRVLFRSLLCLLSCRWSLPQVIPVRLCRRLSRTELRDGRPLPRLAVPSRRHVRPARRRLLVPLRHRVPGSRLPARDAVQRARQALLQRRRVPATTGVAPGRRRGVGTVTGRDVRPARRVLLRLSAGILGRSLSGLRPVFQRKRVCQRRNVSGRTAGSFLFISLNVLAMCCVVSFASL